jgi:hypothetical protein
MNAKVENMHIFQNKELSECQENAAKSVFCEVGVGE